MKYTLGEIVKVKQQECIDAAIGKITKIIPQDAEPYLVEGKKIIGWFKEDSLERVN